MILYKFYDNGFFVISDTLFKNSNSNIPLKYVTKIFSVPHLDVLIFGIGVYEFTKTYYDQILNLITDSFDYVITKTENICIDNYHSLHLHTHDVYTKIFIAKREGTKIRFVSFCSKDNFKAYEITPCTGFFPGNEKITKQINDQLSKEEIDLNILTKILMDNENQLEAGGEYFLHMFSGKDDILIKKLGISNKYKNNLNDMIKNCTIIPKLESKSIYFDQNIWGNLLDELKEDNISTIEKILLYKANDKIHIGYSTENIIETLKRPILKSIFEELSLIKKISGNIFINTKYEFMYKDPFEVWNIHKDIDPVVKKIFSGFIENINALQKTNAYEYAKELLPKARTVNNISPDKIFEYLEKNMEQQLQHNKSDPEFKNLDKEAKKIYSKIIKLIMNHLKEIFGEMKIENTELILDTIKKEMEKKGKEIINQKIDISEIQSMNIDKIIRSLNMDEKWIPGVLNVFLEMNNFYPDNKRLKKKKGVTVDTNDMAHVNYCQFFDYFVTEDRNLAKRINAVKERENFKTMILSMVEFQDMIDQ